MHKIIIEEFMVDEVPFNQYEDTSQASKGLVFIQHGFTSNKERGAENLALDLVRKGFVVVCLDAYKHGKRIQEPFISGEIQEQYFDIFTVVKRTARDIERIFKKLYINRFNSYDIVGISMGGMIAFYLTTIPNHISKVVPVISAPDFMKMSLETFSGELEQYRPFVYQRKEYIEKMSPSNHIDKMTFKDMFMLNTTNDPRVSYKITENFYENEELSNTKFKVYEDVHRVNEEMQEDIISYLLG